MDLDVQQPPVKRQKLIDRNLCLLCNCKIDWNDPTQIVRSPSKEGLQTIFTSSEIRKDEVFNRLHPIRDDLLSGQLHVAFHKTCRASYTSKSNLKHADTDVKSAPDACTESTGARSSRISRDDSFNIRKDCFICGKNYKRNEKLTQIVTGTGDSTRNKVLSSASAREDNVIHLRMVAHVDLFAYDAKYHRSCYACYISERNITSAQKKNVLKRSISPNDEAFDELVDDINTSVLSARLCVVTLSILKSRYVEYLSKRSLTGDVYSWKLKEKLQHRFCGEIVFLERCGQSDLVCASNVTVGDAMRKACELQNAVGSDASINPQGHDTRSTALEEKQILHSAAGILRNSMAKIDEAKHHYEPSTSINMQPCADFIPGMLYDFIMWLTDDQAYARVSSQEDEDMVKNNLRSIALCHNIISKHKQIRTPLTLGLGLYIHHEFGSKHIVDELHALGYCVSYDEIRRFLTSAAIDQQQTDLYIPRGLESNPEIQIDGAIDNFDQNEETLDGKSTTHAMAAVLYKRCTEETVTVDDAPLRRISQKALTSNAVEELIQRYPKPARRPEPNQVKDKSFLEVSSTSDSYTAARNRDLLWQLSRRINMFEQQRCPSWTGFNSLLTADVIPVATVRYLPFIQAPPADFSTIFTVLQRIVQIVGTLGQSHVLITADMQIYAKAQEILWSKPPTLYGKVTMRVGGMHLSMALIACLGKVYGDAGLLSLLCDSEVYAPATARQMLQGKQYARGVRGMKLVMEALFRNLFIAFESWWELQETSGMSPDLEDKLNELQIAIDTNDISKAIDISRELEQKHLSTMNAAIEVFRKAGRDQSETFAFWDTFMKGVETLLLILRSEREANFELHLIATCAAIPWFHAAGRSQYAKFVPVYVAEMKSLKTEHPQSYKHLCDGGFVVRRTSNHNFNCVATDQALEQTVNRDGKSKGGVIGLTLRKGALSRWLKTRHITAEYVEAFRSLCGMKEEKNRIHSELGKARITKDEQDVCKIVNTISQFQNPFELESVPSQLMNIATGQVASNEVRKSMNSFLEDGTKKLNTFAEKRLLQSTKNKSFWDTDSKLILKTFANMRKSLVQRKSTTVCFDSEVLFRRLLVVSKQREVSLENVLKHELAPVPPSLFHDDGSMRKTSKADLARKLEATCDEVHSLDSDVSTAYIIDGMALLQALNDSTFNTFDDLGKQVLRNIMRIFEGNLSTGAITVVFDRYDNTLSIKQFERQRRGDDSRALYVISGCRTVPNYRSFMTNSGNKAALALFVSNYIVSEGPSIIKESRHVILAGGFTDGRVVKQVSSSGLSELPAMFSVQEEADTRMILHAKQMSFTFERIIVRSDDTDVLVLLLFYASKGMLGGSVYMHAGHLARYTNRDRFIPINCIVEMVGNEFCQNLPAVHALTGCDTTSSFFKVGKRTVYSKLVDYVKGKSTSLKEFGHSNSVQKDIDSARSYILTLYGSQGIKCSSLDKLRYLLASTTDRPAANLPPTEDSFKQHVMRARYQTAVWCQSHLSNPVLWDPVGNGWKLTQDQLLEPTMYNRDAAPIEVRDLTHLYCSDKDCNNNKKCQCLQTALKCTEFCGCQADCCNTLQLSAESDGDESD